MQDIETDNVTPLRPLDEEAALLWLQSQPGGKTTLAQVDLAKRWGISRHAVSRRIASWMKRGVVRKDKSGALVVTARAAHHPERRAQDPALAAAQNAPTPPAQRAAHPPAHPPAQCAAQTSVITEEKPRAQAAHMGSVNTRLPARVPDAPPLAPVSPVPQAARLALVSPTVRARKSHWPLVLIAYGFALLGVGINIWNAWSGDLAQTALPAAMGVLAEGVVFFLPAWTLTLPIGRRLLAWGVLAFVMGFALMNSLRMASVTAADTAMVRSDRQTAAIASANQRLEKVQAERDKVCIGGQGKSIACATRQAEVSRLERERNEAAAKVRAVARPDGADFAMLVAWATGGRLQPGPRDFDMFWLLFRTFLPSFGGIVLMLARRG